jgi:hypothetical protein
VNRDYEESLAFMILCCAIVAAVVLAGEGCGGATWPREIEIRIVGAADGGALEGGTR